MGNRNLSVTVWCVAALLLAWPAASNAQPRPQTGTLRVVVQDQSGAVIPGALVHVRGAEDSTRAIVRENLATDSQGVAVAPTLVPGRYTIEASFPGFETRVLADVRVRAGDNRREVTLAIQKVDQRVSVGRDPATSASDPNNDRFSTVLSKDQIDALPDDPDEMEKVLKEMAGPGATIRVDGFRGGRLPPKSQIRSIRFSRDMFAAENHGGGMVFVDIVTQPGLGPMRGEPGLHVPRRLAERAERVPAGEGPRADAAVHVQPERHAARGAHVVLAVGRRGVALRLRERLCRGSNRRADDADSQAGRSDQLQRARRPRADQGAHAARELPAERERTGQPRGRQLRSAGARVLADAPTTACCGCRKADRGAATCSRSRGCSSAGSRASRPRRRSCRP